jgi:hypothetical protein
VCVDIMANEICEYATVRPLAAVYLTLVKHVSGNVYPLRSTRNSITCLWYCFMYYLNLEDLHFSILLFFF